MIAQQIIGVLTSGKRLCSAILVVLVATAALPCADAGESVTDDTSGIAKLTHRFDYTGEFA